MREAENMAMLREQVSSPGQSRQHPAVLAYRR